MDFDRIGAAGRNAARWAEDLGQPAAPGVLHRAMAGDPSEAPGEDERDPRPDLVFFLPRPQPGGEGNDERPSEAEGGSGGTPGEAGSARPLGERQADAQAVADRVYDLMRDEIALARLRGGGMLGRRG